MPYRVYRNQALMKVEQDRVLEGPVWNFLCLENEIATPGDWRITVVGQIPVVVARDADGSIVAVENRCAHRGSLICLDNAGSGARDFQCVYHAWRYDLRGNLRWHCQLSGPRAPFFGPLGLSGAAPQASTRVPRLELPRHRHQEHTTAA